MNRFKRQSLMTSYSEIRKAGHYYEMARNRKQACRTLLFLIPWRMHMSQRSQKQENSGTRQRIRDGLKKPPVVRHTKGRPPGAKNKGCSGAGKKNCPR